MPSISRKTTVNYIFWLHFPFLSFIDRNVIALLRNLRPLFASSCPINLAINTDNDRVLEFFLHNIWPIFGKNICGLNSTVRSCQCFVSRQFHPFHLVSVTFS
ncbi:hypothetical protein niasHT_013307 [Heterodera trifolii]|uniref:Uncharacterized protein n=1 Tax=Heterodera trifolii TaxID=157864 RepID=A0ABD2LAY1_9BILA